MAKTIEELKSQANLIKDETIPAANTASRVGGTIFDMVEKIEDEDTETKKMIKGQSANTDPKTDPHKWIDEINVDEEGEKELKALLDGMASREGVGFYRGSFSSSLFEVETIAVSYDEGNYTQSVRGSLSISSDGTALQYGSTYKILTRVCTGNKWGKWTELTNIVQTTGSSKTSVMSQDAVTKELAKKPGQHNEFGDYFNNSTVNSGQYNHAEGNESRSGGDACHAEGIRTMAAESGSHSEGIETVANNTASHAEGYKTTANGKYAHAEGQGTKANSINSHAEGLNTNAGQYGHAEGNETECGDTAHSEGYLTHATGIFSHTEGNETWAKGSSSHAEGYNNKADAKNSHAEGSGTHVLEAAEAGHSEGVSTLVHAVGGHAEGYNCSAVGTYAHAEGYQTVSSANGSHTEGVGTETGVEGGHVEGTYNIKNDSVHVVGGGSSSERKNLHEIKKDGKQYIIGIGGYNGKNRDSAKDLASVLNESLPDDLIFIERGFPTNDEPLTEDDKSLLFRLSSGTTKGMFFYNSDIAFPVSVSISKYSGGTASVQYTISISHIINGYEEIASASLTKNGMSTSYSSNWSVIKNEFSGGGGTADFNGLYLGEFVLTSYFKKDANDDEIKNSFKELYDKYLNTKTLIDGVQYTFRCGDSDFKPLGAVVKLENVYMITIKGPETTAPMYNYMWWEAVIYNGTPYIQKPSVTFTTIQ